MPSPQKWAKIQNSFSDKTTPKNFIHLVKFFLILLQPHVQLYWLRMRAWEAVRWQMANRARSYFGYHSI
jgi:hypothetical protein